MPQRNGKRLLEIYSGLFLPSLRRASAGRPERACREVAYRAPQAQTTMPHLPYILIDVFFSDEDRLRYLEFLEKLKKELDRFPTRRPPGRPMKKQSNQ